MRAVLVEEFTEFENLKLTECPDPEMGPKQVEFARKRQGSVLR